MSGDTGGDGIDPRRRYPAMEHQGTQRWASDFERSEIIWMPLLGI